MCDHIGVTAVDAVVLPHAQQARFALDQIATKWTVLILTVLCPQPARFNEIMHRLDGITHKSLADALKRLERNGMVERHLLPTAPVGVEYRITELGLSLREPFEALYDWAVEHAPQIADAQQHYDRMRNQ
jgi:DNA-binding HxlR family transcriptional regulator